MVGERSHCATVEALEIAMKGLGTRPDCISLLFDNNDVDVFNYLALDNGGFSEGGALPCLLLLLPAG